MLPYAGATKKLRLNLPDLVYIQKGRDRREPIQKLQYHAFIDYLLDHIMEMKVEQGAKVDIDWQKFSGVLKPGNSFLFKGSC